MLKNRKLIATSFKLLKNQANFRNLQNKFEIMQHNVWKMNVVGKYNNKKLTSRMLSDIVHNYFQKFDPTKGSDFHNKINKIAKEFWPNRKKMLKRVINS